VAECGVETPDTPYIRAAQQSAAQISKLLEDALRTQSISLQDLFDENYAAIAGSNPAQHSSRFWTLADRLFAQVQEKALGLSDKVVYRIAVDRNGYVACHNQKYNRPAACGGRGVEHRQLPRPAASSTTAPAWRRPATSGPSCCRPTVATWGTASSW